MSLAHNKTEDYLFKGLLLVGLLFSLSIFVVLFFLIRSGGHFFISTSISETLFFDQWFPSEQLFGLAPMITGSLLVSALSLALAGPFSLILAFFYFYICPLKLKSALNIFMDIFLSIPSVVFGLWGLVVVVPLLAPLFPPGQGLFTASIILAMMILPIGFKTFVATLQTIPNECLLAAKSCNLSEWSVFKDIIFKSYKRKFFVGFLLQVTRAIGETMAVLMVCGNIIQYPDSLFAPIRTLTTNIALEMSYATDFHRTSLFFCGLLLIGFIFILLLISRTDEMKYEK